MEIILILILLVLINIATTLNTIKNNTHWTSRFIEEGFHLGDFK